MATLTASYINGRGHRIWVRGEFIDVLRFLRKIFKAKGVRHAT